MEQVSNIPMEINSQDEFDREWSELVKKASAMIELGHEKDYKLPQLMNNLDWASFILLLFCFWGTKSKQIEEEKNNG